MLILKKSYIHQFGYVDLPLENKKYFHILSFRNDFQNALILLSMISISFRDFHQLQRRSSASEVEISSTTLSGGCNRHYIKMRLKELQKSRLMAVHDALVVVLEEMKASGEVSIFLLLLMITPNSILPKMIKLVDHS